MASMASLGKNRCFIVFFCNHGCNSSFRNFKSLARHIRNHHNLTIEIFKWSDHCEKLYCVECGIYLPNKDYVAHMLYSK